MRIYLAGPISGLTYEGCTNWREKVQSAFDILESKHAVHIDVFSPMRSKSYLDSEDIIDGSYENHPLSCQKGITTRDRFDCTNADLILVNLLGAEKISIGTVMEIAWADANRIPIVVAMEKYSLHDHPMIRECAGFIVNSLEEAVIVSASILSPIEIDYDFRNAINILFEKWEIHGVG